MATDMHLKLSGIEGESPDDAHTNEIQILSYGFGATQSGTAHEGSGSTSGRADIHDLTFTKHVDKSSPLLYFLCCSGQHLDEAVLSVRKAGGAKPVDYLKVTLTQVLVTSFQSGAQGSQDRASETVKLNFATCKVEYTPQKADGTGMGVITKGWHVAKNTELS